MNTITQPTGSIKTVPNYCHYRPIHLLFIGILLAIGLALCSTQFGTMFWGNWLHSVSFSLGIISVLLAIAVFGGLLANSKLAFASTLGTLLFLYVFLFWTFPGWLLLYKLIHWVLIPGPMPRGM